MLGWGGVLKEDLLLFHDVVCLFNMVTTNLFQGAEVVF